MLVFWLCVGELITLTVFVVGLVLTLGHGTVAKKKYYLDNLMLRFKCFEESNIQELKTRPLLKELAPNINNTIADLHLK